MPRFLRSLAALGVLVPLLAACDNTAPGLPPADARPSVTAFALTPDTDSLGTAAPTASVPLQIAMTVAGTGPVRVRAIVRYTGTDTLVASVTQSVEPGPVTLDVPLALPRGAVGDYAVTVTTEGPDRRAGDGAAGVFRFRASDLGPPSVTAVEAPASVRRPTNPNNVARLRIVVTAADPDGRENLAVVLLEQPGVGIIGPLSDRGRADGSGDATPDDGRYTGELQIPSSFPTGTYTFNALAVDRASQFSEPRAFTFTVE